jgi:hypothetical protein
MAVFLRHLELGKDSSEYQDDMEFAKRMVEGCAGLPLALSMAAGYLRIDPNG